MNGEKETFIAVIYTDGERFINTQRYGRINSLASLPQTKKDYHTEESPELQAALTLFQTTGIRVNASDALSLGYFGTKDDNFDVEVFLVNAKKLPEIKTLKSVRKIKLKGDYEGQSVPSISNYRYTSFNDLDDYTYALEGVKNALTTIPELYAIEKDREEEKETEESGD